jgi:hypothetical protein
MKTCIFTPPHDCPCWYQAGQGWEMVGTLKEQPEHAGASGRLCLELYNGAPVPRCPCKYLLRPMNLSH